MGRHESPSAAELAAGIVDDPHWTPDELSSFASNPGSGRILGVRPGAHDRTPVEQCLRDAGYCLGRLPITRDPSHLPQAAATFRPDVIYVTLDHPMGLCLEALEILAGDPRTKSTPLVAMLPEWTTSQVIEEAYTRSGCDFFRIGGTQVELLARTNLLVRLSGNRESDAEAPALPIPQAANAPMAERLDLRDPITQAYSRTYLRHRLPTETARAHRYQRDLSLLAFRCPDAGQDEAAAAISQMLVEACRDVDLLARVDSNLFVLLLPETGRTGVEQLTARLEITMDEAGFEGRFGHATLGVGDKAAYDADGLLQAACRAAE